MRKHLSFTNVLLFLLIITVLWLIGEIPVADGTVYMPNTDTAGFNILQTQYGNFPVAIDKTKPVEKGTELSVILINPLNINFSEAVVSVHANDAVETVRMNLAPSVNTAKFKLPPVERGETLKITLELDKIYFK
ncbi:MAG: hypothetical protein WBK55_03650 [Alphaproteobacteria bacterium]